MTTEATHGLNIPTTPILEFNEYATQPGDLEDLPSSPTLDLNAKLTNNFEWKFDFPNSTSKFTVVCQFRK